MIVNIHAAKSNLSKLIARAGAGEEIVIARNGHSSNRWCVYGLPILAT
jgi:antitoxin (DNA-binding transcriptional repressor) of toxin-antitoxin stability system